MKKNTSKNSVASQFETSIGILSLVAEDEKLVRVEFSPLKKLKLKSGVEIKETPLLKEASRQIKQYLAGELTEFTIPYHLTGTAFLVKTWEALGKVPYGKVVSYGELAKQIKHPKAFRAVGMAMNRNPLPLILPCHRVVGKKGQLTGFAGGLSLKQTLLNLEQNK